jgi:hypothetical protein
MAVSPVTSIYQPPAEPEAYYHATVERLVQEGRGPRALEVLAAGEESARHQGLHEERLSCLVDGARVLLVCGSRDQAEGMLHGATAVLPHVEDYELILAAWHNAALLSDDGPRVCALMDGIERTGSWAAQGTEREMAIFAVVEKALEFFESGHLASAAVLQYSLSGHEVAGEVFGVPFMPRIDLSSVLRVVGCVRAALALIVEHEKLAEKQLDESPVLRALTLAEHLKVLRTAGMDDAARDIEFKLESVSREALAVLEGRLLEMARADAGRASRAGVANPCAYAGSHLVAVMRRWEQLAEALGGYATVAARSLSPGEVLKVIDPLGDRARQRETLDLVVETAGQHGLRRCAERLARVREYAD